jgi:hypothetical protein
MRRVSFGNDDYCCSDDEGLQHFSLICGTSLVFLNVKIFICGVDNLNLMLYDIDINDILQKEKRLWF